MAIQGFSYVTEDGFIGFLTDLSKEVWGSIDISALQGDTPKSSLTAPVGARWKVRLVESCQAVADNKKKTSKTPKEIDDELWDPLQRALDAETKVFLERDDLKKRAAAQKIRDEFLIGGGRGQTKLAHDKEVDHGRKQVTLAKEQFKDEIDLLELSPLIAKINDATEQLAAALGIGSTSLNTATNRRQDKRGALSDCITAFSAVLDDIEWQLSRKNSDEENKHLTALRTPLAGLLDRYLSEKPAPKKEPSDV